MEDTDPKALLELKKLNLEIAEMERSWWKRPSYILAALPTVLAVIALSVGFLNGFFSAQLTKLENQKHDVEAQIREFEGTRNALTAENEKLRQGMDEKTQRIIGAMGRLNENVSKVKLLTGLVINERSKCNKMPPEQIAFLNEMNSSVDN